MVGAKPILGGDLDWQMKDKMTRKTRNISLLMCTRCSVAPTGNVVVHTVSQPTVNRKVNIEVWAHPYIENLGKACMWEQVGANGGPRGPPFA